MEITRSWQTGFKQESVSTSDKYQWHNTASWKQAHRHTQIHTTEHTSHVHARHTGAQAQTPKVLSVTWHTLNPTCVQTHTAAHLSYCFHLPGLLSNSTRPQIVYRACNIVHLRGNVRRRQMTQSPSTETRKQDGGGTVAARSACVNRQSAVLGMKEGYARWEQEGAHPSRGLVTRTISTMLCYRFALKAKEIKTCFQLVLLSLVVWCPQKSLLFDWGQVTETSLMII